MQKPQLPPVPTREQAQAIMNKARTGRQMTEAGLRALSDADKQTLIHYLTGQRMAVYEALIKPGDIGQRQWLTAQGYRPGFWLSTGLAVWQCQTAGIAPVMPPAAVTLGDVARFVGRKQKG